MLFTAVYRLWSIDVVFYWQHVCVCVCLCACVCVWVDGNDLAREQILRSRVWPTLTADYQMDVVVELLLLF